MVIFVNYRRKFLWKLKLNFMDTEKKIEDFLKIVVDELRGKFRNIFDIFSNSFPF